LRLRLKADGIDYDQFRSEIPRRTADQPPASSQVDVGESEIDAYLRVSRSARCGQRSAAALNLAEILVAVPEKTR
jgi:hypothetical protein